MYQELDESLKNIKFKSTYVSERIGSRYKGIKCCDTIITLDIETTSYFINAKGQPVLYDYKNPQMLNRDKSRMIRQGLMYHWQMTVDGYHFTGRSWEDMRLFFRDLHRRCKTRKFVFIHNFAFEFAWLLNIIDFSGSEDDVFARDAHRTMTAYCKKYNMEFRCTYYLTQLSLAKWGQVVGLDKSKDLDYNVLRTPLTELQPQELQYCLTDVDIMHKGLLPYKEKYKHLYNIPITQTGEVRRELRKVYKHEHGFYDTCRKLQPRNLRQMRWLLAAFYGGCVLCNPAYKDMIIRSKLIFKDIASSYPWAMISERYPLQAFRLVKNPALFDRYMRDPDKTYIVEFTADNIRSLLPCLFLSSSKLTETVNIKTMNGRVATADHFRCILSKPDFEIFKKCYKADIHIDHIKISKLEYLPDGFRRFVIQCYKDKTELKLSDPEIYQKSKVIINGLFGINCQKLIVDQVKFDIDHLQPDGTHEPWYIEQLTEQTFPGLLHEMLYNPDGRPKKIYTATQIGIFVTAYARQNLWRGILGAGVEDVIYTDTDSIKMFYTEEAEEFFETYNADIMAKHKEIAAQLGLDPDDLSPADSAGIRHPIGIYSDDGDVSEFKVMGAKKYCYRDKQTGKLKLTVAGVPKSGVCCLQDDIKEFRDGKIFSAAYMHDAGKSQKMTPVYCTDMQQVTFPDGYTAKDRYGICLIPTDYTLTPSYDMYTDPDEFYRILWKLSRESKLLTQM